MSFVSCTIAYTIQHVRKKRNNLFIVFTFIFTSLFFSSCKPLPWGTGFYRALVLSLVVDCCSWESETCSKRFWQRESQQMKNYCLKSKIALKSVWVRFRRAKAAFRGLPQQRPRNALNQTFDEKSGDYVPFWRPVIPTRNWTSWTVYDTTSPARFWC